MSNKTYTMEQTDEGWIILKPAVRHKETHYKVFKDLKVNEKFVLMNGVHTVKKVVKEPKDDYCTTVVVEKGELSFWDYQLVQMVYDADC